MKTSVRIGRIGNTQIYLHLSLLLILPYVYFQFQPESLLQMAWSLALMAILFVSILLHEIGHTLVARRRGIQVHSIVLWPLGGIAALDHQPEKPADRLSITLAGPLVNLVIGVLLLFGGYSLIIGQQIFAPALFLSGSLQSVAIRLPLIIGIANLLLAGFNLIPIYPLDGGQILRAGLQLLVGNQRADQITLWVAIPLAAILATFALLQRDYVLVGISFLLVLGATSLNLRLLRYISIGYAALANRGIYYQYQGDYDRVVSYFTRAINHHPNRAALYTSRAVAYIHLLEYERARQDIEMALNQDPKSLLAVLLKAELYSLQKNYEQALEWCEKARQIQPDWSFPYIDLGGIYLQQGDLAQAMSALDKAVELSPRSHHSHILRAVGRFRLGDREGALADQEKALKLALKESLVFPEFSLHTLASYLDWSLEYYAWALQRLPGSPHPYHGRANALRASGQWEQAVRDYSQAIRFAPNQADLYLGRGRAHQSAGNLALAAVDYRRAEQLGNRLHLRRQAGELLRALETGQIVQQGMLIQ